MSTNHSTPAFDRSPASFDAWLTTAFGAEVYRHLQRHRHRDHSKHLARFEDSDDAVQKGLIWLWENWDAHDPDYTRFTRQLERPAAYLAAYAIGKGRFATQRTHADNADQRNPELNDEIPLLLSRSRSLSRPVENEALNNLMPQGNTLAGAIQEARLAAILYMRSSKPACQEIERKVEIVLEALMSQNRESVYGEMGACYQALGMSASMFCRWKQHITPVLQQHLSAWV